MKKLLYITLMMLFCCNVYGQGPPPFNTIVCMDDPSNRWYNHGGYQDYGKKVYETIPESTVSFKPDNCDFFFIESFRGSANTARVDSVMWTGVDQLNISKDEAENIITDPAGGLVTRQDDPIVYNRTRLRVRIPGSNWFDDKSRSCTPTLIDNNEDGLPDKDSEDNYIKGDDLCEFNFRYNLRVSGRNNANSLNLSCDPSDCDRSGLISWIVFWPKSEEPPPPPPPATPLGISCPLSSPIKRYEGSQNIQLDCLATGGSGVYTYNWTGNDIEKLDNRSSRNPVFTVPVEIKQNETYKYDFHVTDTNSGAYMSRSIVIEILDKCEVHFSLICEYNKTSSDSLASKTLISNWIAPRDIIPSINSASNTFEFLARSEKLCIKCRPDSLIFIDPSYMSSGVRFEQCGYEWTSSESTFRINEQDKSQFIVELDDLSNNTLDVQVNLSVENSPLPSNAYREISIHGDNVSNSNISYTFFVTSNNNIAITNTENTELPLTTTLHQNYPNPFNLSTIIEYEISHSTDVRIIVYDMSGREVGMVTDGIKSPGTYRHVFQAGNLSSGTYLYRFVTGNQVISRFLTILK